IKVQPPPNFGTNRSHQFFDVVFGQAQLCHKFLVDLNASIQRHSAQSKLRVFLRSDLARNDDVEWSFQPNGHGMTYLDTTSRNCEKTGIGSAPSQSLRKKDSCSKAITKHPGCVHP